MNEIELKFTSDPEVFQKALLTGYCQLAERRSRAVLERFCYAPTLASTSARRKRSMNNMNKTEGTSRISAVIEAT